MSRFSRLQELASVLKASSFKRLIGEEEPLYQLVDAVFFFGVLTSSDFRISAPRRLMEWTSLSSRTVPFGLTFLALEEWDIVGADDNLEGGNKSNSQLITRDQSPYRQHE